MDKNQMNNLLVEINEIKSCVEHVEDIFLVDLDKYDRPFQSFGNIIISGRKTLVSYNNLVDKMWTLSPVIHKSFTRKKINNEVIGFFEETEEISINQLRKVIAYLKDTETKDYWIYKEIDGAILSEDSSITLGPYKILNVIKNKEEIIDNSQYLKDEWPKIFKNCNSQIIIGIKVSVKELQRGYEIADIKFQQFENIVRFLIPDFNKNREIHIVLKSKYDLNKSFSVRSDFYGHTVKCVRVKTDDIDLSNPAFYDERNGTKQLFSILKKDAKSEIEKRILTAIDWIGKGIAENENSKAFIQLMFSIEALLNYKEKDIIQPSILSKISEFIAFTLGSNYEERQEYENDFKRLYSVRSSIAHGNDTNVNIGDFILLLSISRELVLEFLKNRELQELDSFSKYIDWIKKKKYN